MDTCIVMYSGSFQLKTSKGFEIKLGQPPKLEVFSAHNDQHFSNFELFPTQEDPQFNLWRLNCCTNLVLSCVVAVDLDVP